MNKKKILGSLAILATVAIAAFNVSVSSQNNVFSDVSLHNVEALAGETGNTGPAEVHDCAGWGTGSKKVCMSSNSYACTETDCF
ncbi:MAG: NVEALA domain-containing protein [Tannerella sp.]|jgi:hypothetical protein|nr:NVEALA domain-containing protein [Tannerella sp.]